MVPPRSLLPARQGSDDWVKNDNKEEATAHQWPSNDVGLVILLAKGDVEREKMKSTSVPPAGGYGRWRISRMEGCFRGFQWLLVWKQREDERRRGLCGRRPSSGQFQRR